MNFNLLKNTKALSYTIGIHLLLLLIFFFVKYESVALPAPPPEELIELETVALGVDADGFGIEPPEMVMGMPAPPATPSGDAGGNTGGAEAANQTEIPQEDEEHDDVAAVDHPTAAPVLRRSGNPNNPKPNTVTNNRNTSSRNQHTANNTNNRRNNTSNNNSSSNNRTAAPQAKYTLDKASGTGGNGAPENAPGSRNRGDGQGNGQKGQPGGDPNSVNFSGGITGRNIIAYPNPQAEFKDGGTVKIKVWVNREGNIIRHEIQSAKNAAIRAIAEQKIRSVKFNRKPDAAVEQSGILTFNFKAGTGR